MRLIKTIKPYKFIAKTKEELISIMSNGKIVTITNNFSGWSTEKYKYGMNFEKHKKKVERYYNNGIKRNYPKVIKEKHWVGYLYVFEKDFPISIKQNARNFDFKY